MRPQYHLKKKKTKGPPNLKLTKMDASTIKRKSLYKQIQTHKPNQKTNTVGPKKGVGKFGAVEPNGKHYLQTTCWVLLKHKVACIYLNLCGSYCNNTPDTQILPLPASIMVRDSKSGKHAGCAILNRLKHRESVYCLVASTKSTSGDFNLN